MTSIKRCLPLLLILLGASAANDSRRPDRL